MPEIFNKIKILLIYLIIIFGIAGLLTSPSAVISSVKDGLILCQNIVIPSLFPFFVFSALAVDTGLFDRATHALSPLMRIFNVSVNGAPSFILGIFAGYPIGAKTAISLYKSKQCSKGDAERLLAFSNNPGPAFVFGVIGVGIFGDLTIGILLFVLQIVSSVITGIVFGFLWKSKGGEKVFAKVKNKKMPFTSCFVSAVKNSAVNILFICAFVLSFCVFIKLLFVYNVIPSIAGFLTLIFSVFGLNAKFFENFFIGFFEIITGVNAIGLTASSSMLQNLTLTSVILGWSGLSIHSQVLFFMQDSGLSKKPYFLGKLLQSSIAGFLTYSVIKLFHFDIYAFANFSKNLSFIRTFDFFGISMISIALIFILLFLILISLCFKKNKTNNIKNNYR